MHKSKYLTPIVSEYEFDVMATVCLPGSPTGVTIEGFNPEGEDIPFIDY